MVSELALEILKDASHDPDPRPEGFPSAGTSGFWQAGGGAAAS